MRMQYNSQVERKINDNVHKYLLQCGAFVEREAKINMDVLYDLNHPYSYRGFDDPSIKAEQRSGLARASIHVEDRVADTGSVLVGADEKTFATKASEMGVNTGSVVFYLGILEAGTRYIPPIGMLRNALDKLIGKVKGKRKK